MKLFLSAAAIIFPFFSPASAEAVYKGLPPTPADFGIPPVPTIQSVGGLVGIVANIVGWVYTIFFIVAVLFILLAAYKYLTAGGDIDATKEARQMLIYASIAIVVALLAIMFKSIIFMFLLNPMAGPVFINAAFAAVVPGEIPAANDLVTDVVPIENVSGLAQIVVNVVAWTYTIFFIVAVFFILLAAFKYLTAGENADAAKEARQMLIYASIAIAIALLAVMFNYIVIDLIAPSAISV